MIVTTRPARPAQPKNLDHLTDPRARVPLAENTVLTLLAIVINDLRLNQHFPYLQGPNPVIDFFKLSLNEQDFIKGSSELKNVIDYTYNKLLQFVPDAERYLNCLAKFHRTRLKYNNILSSQELPSVEAVLGKGLLHFGLAPNDTIMGFLRMNKLFYDLDNRAAQEMGYLFEPIIAGAIGGESFSGSKSPVKRDGEGKGRQVDCLKGDNIYEIKSRLTNAASGQGRWKEELSFPEDCVASGYTPVLLVLFVGENENHEKLEELAAKFREHGEAYIGEEAWAYMNRVAGQSMSVFLTKYIKRPLIEMHQDTDVDKEITIKMENSSITVSDENGSINLRKRYVSASER